MPVDVISALRRLPRDERRVDIERRLNEHFPGLVREPRVAAVLAGLRAGPRVVSHYTFDEPELGGERIEIQFTYHLSEPSAGDGSSGGEIRGSGIAIIARDGTVRFEDVDAELFLDGGDATD